MNVRRSNSIPYRLEWANTVAFYRDGIALEPTHEVDWFVEFALHDPEGNRIELWETER